MIAYDIKIFDLILSFGHFTIFKNWRESTSDVFTNLKFLIYEFKKKTSICYDSRYDSFFN